MDLSKNITLTVEQYKDAIKNSLSESQIEMLKILYHFPNSTANATDLAKALNYKSYHAANRQVGETGKTIANYLGVTPLAYYDGKIERPAYFLLIGPYGLSEGQVRGTTRGWEMKENLMTALEELSLVSKSDRINDFPKTEVSHNNTYIILWNPKKWTWSTLEQDIEQVDLTGKCSQRWSCGNIKSIKAGDRIFLLKLGTEPKGIIAAGFATTEPFREKHWGDENKESSYIDVDFEVLLNPEKEPILTVEVLRMRSILHKQNWSPQSANSLKPELIDELESVWFEFLTTQNIRHNPFIPSINETQKTYSEGSASQITVTKYERNPFARKKCLEHYGFTCAICDFNFEKVYGEIGKGFIHVHHLTQVASVGETYEVDPIKDLRPVCPNCHSIIHKNNTKPYTIEEVKSFINSTKN